MFEYIILFISILYVIYNKYKINKCVIINDINIKTSISNNIKLHLNDKELIDMCEYALDGKNLRSKLIIATYNKLNSKINDNIINVAIAIEYIHNASLIIDDIMDCDKIRRNKESVYAKYGTNKAHLCSLTLMALAYQNIFSSLHNNKNLISYIHTFISRKLVRLVSGQFIDINSINNIDDIKYNNVDIIKIIEDKTGSLFELCFMLPWLYANNYALDDISKVGKLFGLIYQMVDDLVDYEQDMKRSGKNISVNYAIKYSKSVTVQHYNKYKDELVSLVNKYNIMSNELNSILVELDNTINNYK